MNLRLFNLFESLSDDVDGILIFDNKLLKYYTGVNGIEGAILVLRRKSFLFVDFRYFEVAKYSVKNISVLLSKNLKKDIANFLNKEFAKKIAVYSEGLLAKVFFDLKNYCKDVELFFSEKLDYCVNMQTAVKTNLEIKKIACAQNVAQQVLQDVLSFIRPGVSEIEVAREINSLICKRADGTAFETIVVSGKRTSLPHGLATEKLLEIGDFVTLDFGAVVDGYRSDMTRTICLGSPSPFQKEVYEIVLRAQQMALEKIHVGVSCSSVDLLVRNYFAKHGYGANFGHSLGHGVGLKIHEMPYISSSSLEKFEKNMVCTVEPGLYFENKFGVRIEDLVLVVDDGVFNFTNFDKNLICL